MCFSFVLCCHLNWNHIVLNLQWHSLINTNHINTDGKKAQSDEGNNSVTCVTFLHHGRNIIHDVDDYHNDDRNDNSNNDSNNNDHDDIPIFQCRLRFWAPMMNIITIATIPSKTWQVHCKKSRNNINIYIIIISSSKFSHNKTFLATFHANGEALCGDWINAVWHFLLLIVIKITQDQGWYWGDLVYLLCNLIIMKLV